MNVSVLKSSVWPVLYLVKQDHFFLPVNINQTILFGQIKKSDSIYPLSSFSNIGTNTVF